MEKQKNTKCILRKLKRNMELSEDFLGNITNKFENILAVIPNDLRKIVVFPTNAESGLYCKIRISKDSKLDESFFTALRERLAKFQLKTLYTTGVCYSKQECYWEGVFEYYKEFPLQKFKRSLENIGSAKDITLDVLKIIE
ncbi:MAG: hypothetical protein GF364_00420 [Candidatus Lokiarchaeota archaeon]|nr:hypothetical protein [Candidatus Lokiarchaeota archaeon]